MSKSASKKPKEGHHEPEAEQQADDSMPDARAHVVALENDQFDAADDLLGFIHGLTSGNELTGEQHAVLTSKAHAIKSRSGQIRLILDQIAAE